MKEKIIITIEDLDDIHNVLISLELLFQKLIFYYTDTNVKNLEVLLLSCSVYFKKILELLEWNDKDIKELGG